MSLLCRCLYTVYSLAQNSSKSIRISEYGWQLGTIHNSKERVTLILLQLQLNDTMWVSFLLYPSFSLIACICIQCVGCPQSVTRAMFATIVTWHLMSNSPWECHMLSGLSDCNLLCLHVSWRISCTFWAFFISVPDVEREKCAIEVTILSG